MALVYSNILNEVGEPAKRFTCSANQISLLSVIWRPRTKQGLRVRLIVGLWLTLALAIFLARAVSRTATPLPVMVIPDYLLPGRSLPEAASCISGDAGSRYISHCTVFQEGLGQVYLSYDERTQVICRAGVAVDSNSIGDFIRVWGQPDGYRYGNGISQIYWGTISASVGGPLTLASRIGAIHYDLKLSDLPQDRLAWRGFVTLPS